MADRPILFSGPMVRAILSGAKTQTRRVVTPQPEFAQLHEWRGKVIRDCEARAWCWKAHDFGDGDAVNARPGSAMHALSPYGVPGDRLWVRETWYDDFDRDPGDPADVNRDGSIEGIEYRATHDCTSWEAGCPCNPDGDRKRSEWRPSIHMPRWASRITLEVEDVRAERLQEITNDDAKREGVEQQCFDGMGCWLNYQLGDGTYCLEARSSFETLWDSINGSRPGCSWEENCWVWRIAFRRVDANAEAAQ